MMNKYWTEYKNLNFLIKNFEKDPIKLFLDERFGFTADNFFNKDNGYVYILEFDTNLVKIGYTNNVIQRLKNINKNYFFNFEINRILVSDRHENAKQIERLLHKYFSNYIVEKKLFDDIGHPYRKELFFLEFNTIKEDIDKINLYQYFKWFKMDVC